MDPDDIVNIADLSPDTFRRLIESLEGSTEFAHFVYREGELDEVWTLIDLSLKRETQRDEMHRLQRLLRAVQEAHDLVAAGKPLEAAQSLRRIL